MFPSARAVEEERARDVKTSPKGKSALPPFLVRYRTFAYRLFGRALEGGADEQLLADRLKQAGINESPGMYRSVVALTAVIFAPIAAVLSTLLFRFVIASPIWYLWVVLLTAVTLGSTVIGFRSVITSRITNRKAELDRELPFTLSELSVLASTGVSPIELIRRMSRRDHDLAMTAEFRTVVYKADIQGKDLITALAETAKESPSNALRESFWDLANMIHQGGNLDEYLRTKSDDVLQLKRSVQKEFIERLSTFLDMYVSLVLIGVLMISVGAFLINAFGSTIAGIDANELLLLLTFGLVPIAVVMTVVLISMAWSRAE
jgi:archaeal flagellar protein FlaJ